MGRYLKGEGQLQQKEWKGFDSPSHMVHFLAKTRKDDPNWQHVVGAAKDFLAGRKVPKYTSTHNDLRKIIHYHPHKLAGEVMHDLRRAREGKRKGAGLTDAFWSVVSEGAHLVGVDKIAEWVGIGPKHVPMTESQIEVARALRQSYKPVTERKLRLGDMRRLPEYDTDRIAVWRQSNGQLLVTVHGTKLSLSDIVDDVYITVGQKTRSTELETLLQTLDTQGEHYDIAGHSLATQFIQNAIIDGYATGSDDVLLFNPASSPFQNQEYLKENANDPKYTYFINQGDLVSSGLYQNMNEDTLNNRVHMGPWRWDPLHAHYMDQWTPDEDEKQEQDAKQSEEEVKANFPVGSLDAWFDEKNK